MLLCNFSYTDLLVKTVVIVAVFCIGRSWSRWCTRRKRHHGRIRRSSKCFLFWAMQAIYS